ncbi:MAG TPA: CBS domain-containing protein [Streptosporangiaceae bacterium]
MTTLVVLDDQTGQPAGIITDTDVAHVVADGKDVNNVRISDAMTRDPAFVDAATSLQEVAELMTVRHLPACRSSTTPISQGSPRSPPSAAVSSTSRTR